MAEERVVSDFHVEEIALFLTEERGNLSATARRMKVSRQSLKDKVDRTVELKFLVDELLQGILDQAERNIFDAVAEQGDLNQSQFVLKTLGKDRGYVTKKEIDATVLSGEEQARRIQEARQRAAATKEEPAPVPEEPKVRLSDEAIVVVQEGEKLEGVVGAT